MAPSHVPSDHLPLQGQNIYTDSGFENLFPSVEQYGTPSWNAGQLNHHHDGLSNTGNQSWHHNSFPQQSYNQISQPYGNQNNGYQTASPYQYGQFSNHGSMGNYGHSSNVDPSLGIDPNAIRQQQQSPYQMPVRNPTPQAQNTVTPQALQQGSAPIQNARTTASPYQIPKSTTELFAQRATPTTLTKPVSNPEYEIPKGKKSGGFYVLDQAALAKATKSNALNKLVTFGSEPLHLAVNRTVLPVYTARQSMKELKKAGADNKKLLGKKSLSTKSSHSKSLKAVKAAGSPAALKKEVSDSESYTESSENESDYTDDEEMEPSPLPATRPDEPHGAVRYDIIKATWYPRKSQVGSEKIKASMVDLWEILNTIHKRWRADSKAVTEAEDAKKTGELPVLKSRVTSQRDLLQSALRSSLEFAHPDVLYHLGKVKQFLYLCYQFLANRFKAQDYDGPVSSAIYEILVRCAGTLTTELLEETKVIKALNSMKKNANEKNKNFIQQILDSAALGSKKPKASSPPEVESSEPKNVKRPATQPAGRPTSEGPAVKKLKPTETAANVTRKNATATPIAKITPSAGTVPQKRPGEKPTSVPTPAKPRGSQVVNKPSAFFSSLNAASKKPTPAAATTASAKANTQQKPAASGTKEKKPAPVAAKPAFSFAETMAQLLKPKEETQAPAKPEKQLPPETSEEKTRRLRKESRRHLRVSFRPDASLVSIRYFHHDPEEEMGHDENFVRDAGDIGGEGRMFKQHKDMDDEEDDDDDLELEYRTWREPSSVDFSVIDPEERKRNYYPYGGGESKPSSPEKEANERRENSTLLVFYSHPSDIPSSPREPLEQQTQLSSETKVTQFGPPPDFVVKRSPQPDTPAPAPDISSLENIFKQFAAPVTEVPQATTSQPAYTPPPPTAPPAPVPDLASILSALGQSAPQTPAPAPAPAPDVIALLSAIQASGSTGALPPPPPGFPPFPLPFQPQQQQDSGLAFQTQPQAQFNQHANGGTKRQREDANHNNDQGNNTSKRQKGHKNHHSKGDRPHRVVECKFFKKGMCNKGDDCTFIHDLNM